MTESRTERRDTKITLDLREAAAHCGFTIEAFKGWLRYNLFPAADPNTGHWYAQQLSAELDRLQREGYLPCILAHKKHQHFTLPNVHPPRRKVNHGGYNGYRRYYYFRPTGDPIAGLPGSAEFMTRLIDFERRYAAQKKTNQPLPASIQPGGEPIESQTTALAEQQQKPPSISSDALLHIGGVVPSDQQLPLYPSEREIGIAVLGVQRAHEWPAVAEALEREGLPLADPLTGARFWPLVQAYFAARHGLDGGLASNKRAAAPQQPTKIALHAPKVVTQKESIESTQVMPTRRRSAIIQADIARTIRAAKQAGAARVEVRLSDSSTAIVRLGPDGLLEFDEDIIL